MDDFELDSKGMITGGPDLSEIEERNFGLHSEAADKVDIQLEDRLRKAVLTC